MSPVTVAATRVAEQVWARMVSTAEGNVHVTTTADRLCANYRVGLARWIGVEGYRALLGRALVAAESEHPVLGRLPFLGGDDFPSDGNGAHIDDGTALRYDELVGAGMVALLVQITILLGRIIGNDLALRLVQQIGLPETYGAVTADDSHTTEADRNDE